MVRGRVAGGIVSLMGHGASQNSQQTWQLQASGCCPLPVVTCVVSLGVRSIMLEESDEASGSMEGARHPLGEVMYADSKFIYAMDDCALLRRMVHFPTGSRSGLPENTRTLVEF